MEGVRMEMFIEKVRCGGVTRFDPLLDKRGGWITNESSKPYAEITNVEIATLDEHATKNTFNPFNTCYWDSPFKYGEEL